jgi:hypothetical protein
MFTPRHQIHPAWLLLFAVIVIAAGCGQDKATTPLNQAADTASPSTPTGLAFTGQTDTKFMIEWTPCADADVAGYRIYRYDPDPSRQNAYVALSETPWIHSGITLRGTPGTTYFFRVTSLDTSSNESAMSDPITFTFDALNGSLPGEDGSGNEISTGGVMGPGTGHPDQPNHVGELPIGKK